MCLLRTCWSLVGRIGHQLPPSETHILKQMFEFGWQMYYVKNLHIILIIFLNHISAQMPSSVELPRHLQNYQGFLNHCRKADEMTSHSSIRRVTEPSTKFIITRMRLPKVIMKKASRHEHIQSYPDTNGPHVKKTSYSNSIHVKY